MGVPYFGNQRQADYLPRCTKPTLLSAYQIKMKGYSG